jgi:hypothetical protein
MRKLLLGILALASLAICARAQVMAVHFKDEKTAKKYKENLSLITGEWVVVCEAKFGVAYDPQKQVIQFQSSGKNEFYVADPDDPSFVPYKLKDGERVTTDKRGVVTIQGQHIDSISILIQQQSLYGLSLEYQERQKLIDELIAQRDKCAKGGRDWFGVHQRLLSQYERMMSWMTSTAFPMAAKKVAKELERQRKVVAADAAAARVAAAKATVHMVDTPAELTEASQAITGGKVKFKIQESQHVRITYIEDVGDERVRALLEFAEVAIDGFRGDCVDPYIGADFEDKIPDRLFAEFFFGPDDVAAHERFFTDYYKLAWGDRKDEQLKLNGKEARRPYPPENLHYWRLAEHSDLEGMVAHNLGHDLAEAHYNGNQPNMPQDWIGEGTAFYLSLEFLGRNSVTCKAFADPGRYVHEKGKEGEKTLQLGLRDFYNSLALDSGPVVDKLALKKLAEMEDADLAKCWSMYDYLIRKEGKLGQQWLRTACEKARDKATFMKAWREKSEAMFNVQGQDVFKLIEARWRAFAEAGQDTGDTARAK